jgi:hypothetical protein
VKLPLVPVRLFEQKYKKRENLENLKMIRVLGVLRGDSTWN